MGDNGAGVFNRVTATGASWADDAAIDPVIYASTHDTHDTDIAAGLTNRICRDGQTTTTARIPFAQGISLGGVGATSVGPLSGVTSLAASDAVSTGALSAASLSVTGATTFNAGVTFNSTLGVVGAATFNGAITSASTIVTAHNGVTGLNGVVGAGFDPLGYFIAERTSGPSLYLNRMGTDGAVALFNRAQVQVGDISVTGTATTYGTSSDHRLKQGVTDLTGSGAFIDALRPRRWTWAQDGSAGVGFVAHEAQAVTPSSVRGAKDATDGSGRPVYQSMQPGSPEIIAHLVAEVKSLRARLAAAGL